MSGPYSDEQHVRTIYRTLKRTVDGVEYNFPITADERARHARSLCRRARRQSCVAMRAVYPAAEARTRLWVSLASAKISVRETKIFCIFET